MEKYRHVNKDKKSFGFVVVILSLLVLATVANIFITPDFSKSFILIYALLFVLLLIFSRHTPVRLSGIFRSLVGLLFIFSSFVKGVDPIGFSYKIHDYLSAYNMTWLNSLSLILAIAAITVEFVVGIAMLLDIKPKFFTVIASLLMIFFTILTLMDALYNKVPDCGCFGDAVIMTNWQTFYKNLTIDLALLIVWFSFNKIKPLFYNNAEIGITITFTVLFLAMEIYCLLFLPIVDFRDWKVGKKMTLDNPLPIEYYAEYRNDTTGMTKIYKVEEIPYYDSTWMEHWQFVRQSNIDKNEYPHNVRLFDETSTDVTNSILSNPDYHVMIVSYSIENMKMKNFDKLKALIDYCVSHNYSLEFVTSSEIDTYNEFVNQNELHDLTFCNADDIELKAMIRSNPGIVAMKNGVVIKKWSRFNIPNEMKLDKYLQ